MRITVEAFGRTLLEFALFDDDGSGDGEAEALTAAASTDLATERRTGFTADPGPDRYVGDDQ